MAQLPPVPPVTSATAVPPPPPDDDPYADEEEWFGDGSAFDSGEDLAAALFANSSYAALIIDQNQANFPVYMAAFSQTGLAQSFQQTHNNIAGAGIRLRRKARILLRPGAPGCVSAEP